MTEETVPTFADAFDIFAEITMPDGATQDYRNTMRRCFFAGAAIIVGSMKTAIEKDAPLDQLRSLVLYMESDLMSDITVRAAAAAGKPN